MRPPLDPELFDFDPGILWVMHCADGPSPKAAGEAARDMLGPETRPWTLRFRPDVRDLPAEVRRLGARVLGAEVDDVGLTATTSSGLVTVIRGLRWGSGDRIRLPQGEFPTNAWPWLALERWGADIRTVPLWPGHRSGAAAWQSTPPTADGVEGLEERLLEALDTGKDEDIRPDANHILAASWIRFQDGLVLDLGTLARGCAERGADLVVDGIQGAGLAVPDLDGVAAFASGGHKGLLGPHGLGLLWTASRFRERLAPTGSWLSVEGAYDFDRPNTDFDRQWLPTAERLEQGVPNLVGAALFRASLELLAEVGPERIAAHVAGLRARLIEGLARLPAWAAEADRLAGLDAAGRLGPIVALHHGNDADGDGSSGQDRFKRLARAGYGQKIYSTVREGYLRIALHGWHDEGDIERLLDWLGGAPG